MSDKLKRCPFCGNDRELNKFPHWYSDGKEVVKVQCLMCLSEAPEHIWNIREADALIAQLKADHAEEVGRLKASCSQYMDICEELSRKLAREQNVIDVFAMFIELFDEWIELKCGDSEVVASTYKRLMNARCALENADRQEDGK